MVRARYLPIPLLAGFVLAVMPALGASQSVTATSNVFTPETVTINQGETVTWSNGGGTHNVHFEDGSFDQPAAPSGSAWTVSRTFNQAGTFTYYCEQHRSLGMVGTVVVNAASGTTQPGTTQPGTTNPETSNPYTTVDTVAPRITAKATKLQRLLRQRAVVLSVHVDEPASVSASGRIALPHRKAFQLRQARIQLAGGATAKLKLRLSKKGLAVVRKVLRGKRRLSAKAAISARDASGNVRRATLKLSLRA